jgi:hypothetical protein
VTDLRNAIDVLDDRGVTQAILDAERQARSVAQHFDCDRLDATGFAA